MNPSLRHHAETTVDDVSERPTRTALVLGGGGSTGNAWLIGVVAGLFDAGIDVTDADLTIGTSAGSTAAAQFAGATPTELLAAVLAADVQPLTGPSGPDRGRNAAGSVADHLERLRALIASAVDQADLRRRVGARALELEAASPETRQAQWRATVASRLPSPEWPGRRILITAVDAETGAPIVFDRDSGIDLVDAVAASCSSGAAYRVDGHAYIDGGFRSNAENADLASGCARVLVLSPFGGRSLVPASWGTHLATQLDELRARGSGVETIVPDRAAEHLFGANGMDPTLRPPAARAGYDQGRALADRVAEFWR
ncbi:patatin-like phospholipase family protein [Agromyces mariniharenae]|uniref:Patatin-like phospholipase family protein n=1 Tax=Agromyces mariniharenae TaxID=2604423 RepID=A0A5S4VA29_9MICO|nr:patatin-like phospholipase family protein [Agromyces mariniharenae]TYL50925.1 patatin-like phospholipase family protein [Agromyces mariniharenae]